MTSTLVFNTRAASLPLSPQIEFDLPADLEAGEPVEARGLARDQVRLLVSHRSDNRIEYSTFRQLGTFLAAGDVIVINTSGTIKAAIHAWRSDGFELEFHLSTCLPDGTWTVELRTPAGESTVRFRDSFAGEVLRLDGGAEVTIERLYDCGCHGRKTLDPGRLRIARIAVPAPATKDTSSMTSSRREDVIEHFAQFGFPIRYSYVRQQWPIDYYQTVYATEPGSAEMPSAGRGFTRELMQSLRSQGVIFAPIVLHTGVASLESHEPPYEEYFRISDETARIVRSARSSGHRVIAVGTTVVRALETVLDTEGDVQGGEGWTCHVVSSDAPIRSADGLLSGLHEPKSSHLSLLEGLASRDHLKAVYRAALQERYKWHEFGDLHLLLP